MTQSMTVLLIRHGETEYNKSGIIQGHVDSPLTAEGTEQARRLGKRLQTVGINAVWHSDLGRAVQTAQLLNLGVNMQSDSRLREINCGMADGSDFLKIKEEHPDYFKRWHAEDPSFCFPGGESFPQVQDRMWTALLQLIEQHQGETVAVVSHGMALRLLLKRVLQIPFGQSTGWYLRNTSVTRVEYSAPDVWQLLSFGDVAHLDAF
jgi:probable phosphoglycerate mutase